MTKMLKSRLLKMGLDEQTPKSLYQNDLGVELGGA